MAWALLKLAAWSGEARFRDAALAAITYERSTFVEAEANWPDYRSAPGKDPDVPVCELAWCHGAPGIALARSDGLLHLDDHATRAEIQFALDSTLRTPLGRNHCLCHGDLGNIEVLLLAAERMDQRAQHSSHAGAPPDSGVSARSAEARDLSAGCESRHGCRSGAWRAAAQGMARATLRSIAARGLLCGGSSQIAPPGLMVGLSGIGYAALRLAAPARVPSVLILERPRLQAAF